MRPVYVVEHEHTSYCRFLILINYNVIMAVTISTLLFISCSILLAGLSALFLFTQFYASQLAKRHPPIGQFVHIDGVKLHVLIIKATCRSEVIVNQSPIIFIHGASGNLQDQYMAFREHLDGSCDAIFVDRPGHGWSERGKDSDKFPDNQADYILKLMDHLAYNDAIIVGHSYGCTLALSLALKAPERLKGLLCLAPVAYPWPGGIAWYYNVAAMPIIGHIFTNLFTLPVGLRRVPVGSKCVFLPNPMPADYMQQTAPRLVLRPKIFRNNSKDIASLEAHVIRTWPSYKNIQVPTVIISGKRDNVVFPYIHSKGLAFDLQNADLIELDHLGHKPDHMATELVMAAIDKIQYNHHQNLASLAENIDRKLSNDLGSMTY